MGTVYKLVVVFATPVAAIINPVIFTGHVGIKGMMLHSKDGELLATCYAAIRTSILILSRQLQVINKPKRVPVQ
ncbi:hypothetical protein HanRHA438_Chr02g0085651 [Helianthus annuus]|nr:hypothetical protein HanRHA438_Chr02g0085651 [Helianthus annuus]